MGKISQQQLQQFPDLGTVQPDHSMPPTPTLNDALSNSNGNVINVHYHHHYHYSASPSTNWKKGLEEEDSTASIEKLLQMTLTQIEQMEKQLHELRSLLQHELQQRSKKE
jgi:hypothetical protein